MPNHSFSVYVFDLDGVVTDPESREINEEVIEMMYQLLERGNYLAANTGRSFSWVKEHVVSRLETHGNKEIFDRFTAVCEKGGEMAIWQDGAISIELSEYGLPRNAYEITKSTFQQNKSLFQTMIWDDTKQTMATIGKKLSASLQDFHTEQSVLVDKLSAALSGHQVKIDLTTAATDVELPGAGKYAGAHMIYQWIGSTIIPTDYPFISIGDSTSDYEMARYFAKRGANSTFVYVGKPTDEIQHNEQTAFITPGKYYAIGTLEYLTNN